LGKEREGVMSFNPSLKVADAREYGAKHDKAIVVIFAIGQDGIAEVISYGKDKALCREAKYYGKRIFQALGLVEG
jgi:hypothetical protein